jgi:hypothetical protein
MKTKLLVLSAALMLSACQGEKKQIIADVCKPINDDNTKSFDKLVAEKGYNKEKAQAICHQYVLDMFKTLDSPR